MRILDQFLRDGDRLFRWRSYFPLALVPVILLGLVTTGPPFGDRLAERAWEVASLAVALLGLAIRVWAVGTAPPGTSERSTVNPRASELRISGLYSIVRHPLYLGNGLMGLGISLFPGVWYLPLVMALATLLYYERIAAREEAFLEDRFGEAFRTWAVQVPAIVPSLAQYRPATTAFSWRKVFRHEFHGLLVIASGALLLDMAQESLRTGAFRFDPVWLWVFGVSAALFVVASAIKKTTGLFDVRDPDPRVAPAGPKARR